MTRYKLVKGTERDLDPACSRPSCGAYIGEAEDGDFVLYADALPALEEIENLRCALKRRNDEVARLKLAIKNIALAAWAAE